MKIRFASASLLTALCLLSCLARADDLATRAVQIKAQLQTKWLPAWAVTPTANESARDAAQLLQTLSHAGELGYASANLDLSSATGKHYKRLRDLLRDKTGGGFYESNAAKDPAAPKSTLTQAQIVLALVEYARATKGSEPRGLAIKTWRLLRERARDQIGGGYFDGFLSGKLTPTQASGIGDKSANTHRRLLEAGAALFQLTRDRSIKRDVEELLDLNQGRFFPVRLEEGAGKYSFDWKPLAPVSLSEQVQAGPIIARAQDALGLPVGWVDLSRRADGIESNQATIYAGGAVDSLSLLARNLPASRERRAGQLDALFDALSGQTPDVHSGLALLDFVTLYSFPTDGHR